MAYAVNDRCVIVDLPILPGIPNVVRLWLIKIFIDDGGRVEPTIKKNVLRPPYLN
jgi:hypothetical protein